MKSNRIYLQAILLSGALLTSSAWAAPGSCTYTASGSGIDGTGISGTGMGGTGIIAKGTGMGGTGMKPGSELAELQVAGNVIYSHGPVEAQSNGRTRLLAKGDPVCVGETIVTAQSAMVQIRMVDDGLIAIRPQTQLKIEKFAYNGTDQDTSLMSLFKGASRFVTGKVGKMYPQNDLIHTPNATIGVRGTDHEAAVILPGNSGGYPSGTYDKVNLGITFIKTDKGEIDILPNQVGLAEDMAKLPALLNTVPEFYKVDPSSRGRNEQHEKGKSGDGSSDRKMDGSSRERTGKGTEYVQPSETGHRKIESRDNYLDLKSPGSASPMEMPNSQEAPSIQQLPETSDHSD
jgi:hypothetical protein